MRSSFIDRISAWKQRAALSRAIRNTVPVGDAASLFESLERRQLMSAVTGLVLVNADTGKDIRPLTNNSTINLATLPTTHLTVRADVGRGTGSVQFNLNGKLHVENDAPYDLAGDSGWGHYNAWTPSLGSNILTVTPYSRNNGSGQAGTADTVKFTVVNKPAAAPAITKLILVNADTGKDIETLKNNSTLDLATLPTTHLTVRADVNSSTSSVVFTLDGQQHTENDAPYDLAGDQGWGHYNSWTPRVGAHTLSVRAYTDNQGTGRAGVADVVKFTVINSSASTPANPTPPSDPTPPSNPVPPTNPTPPTNPVPPSDPTPPTDPTPPSNPAPPSNPTPPTDPAPPSNPTPPANPAPPTNPTPPSSPTPPDTGSGPAAPNLPGNWTLKFDDEFNTSLNNNTWTQSLWGMTHFSGEQENYAPSGVSVSNGMLTLTATQQSTASGYAYTSGLVSTGGVAGQKAPGFSFKYGYVEARMKLTAGKGLWPAFWMLPTPDANGNYHDGDGEIDIMEALGDEPTIDQMHLHHNGTVGKAYDAGVDLTQGFHTYGLDWEPDHITWYLDGKAVYTVTANVPSVPEYLIFNLAVGDANSWPGAPDSSTSFPATMQVDWVHVWQTA